MDKLPAMSVVSLGPASNGMNTSALPALVATAGERAGMRFLEFFAANIRNPHTRRAYARAADEFLAWCASVGVPSIGAVQPVRVATWIEAGTRELAAPSVKQRLAAIRHLFDWLVTGQVVSVNPAGSVRGPRHVVTSGQTPVLAASERVRDDPPARARGPALPPSSATTASARPGSRRISRTAARWKRPPRWRTMPQHARRSSTIAGAMRSASMRLSGS
jgi:hypothetical protein